MSENYFDEELLRELSPHVEAGDIAVRDGSDVVFEEVAKIFPALGSKIDWGKVAGSVEDYEPDESRQYDRFIAFFDHCLRNIAGEEVMYVGDSATDIVLVGDLSAIRSVLPMLLEFPQHHYFMGNGFEWCLSLGMEGDMGFGYAPSINGA